MAAALPGDESAFDEVVKRHQRELRVHCYRMVGSLQEADDLVQETFLRAWKGLDGFEGRSTLRSWLYRIATNACLDWLTGRARRVLPYDLGPASDPRSDMSPPIDIPWLQPFPDRLLDAVAPDADEPDARVVSRETIELTFVAAIQHLPPRQRAVLILRDVVGWSATETAEQLDISVASANSALHRARATLRRHLPERRSEWPATAEPSDRQRAFLRRYMDAMERSDLSTLAELLAVDIRTSMPPWPAWFEGRSAVLAALEASWDASSPGYVGRFRMLPTRANRQPAVAAYVRGLDDAEHLPFAISVLHIADDRIAEIVAFHDLDLFPRFDLPGALPPAD